MTCTNCHSTYENGAQYCQNCGQKTMYNPTLGKSNNNVTAVWLFAALFIGTSLFYRLLSHVVIPNLRSTENWEMIGNIYETTGMLVLLADLLVSGIVIGIIKNTSARVAVGLYAVFTLLMFVMEKVMEAAKIGDYSSF